MEVAHTVAASAGETEVSFCFLFMQISGYKISEIFFKLSLSGYMYSQEVLLQKHMKHLHLVQAGPTLRVAVILKLEPQGKAVYRMVIR